MPLGTYDRIPGMDSGNNLTPEVRNALLSTSEFVNAFAQRVLKGDFGIHIKDYIPTPDGVTDNTTNFLAAANAAKSARVPLVLDPTKTYVLNGLVLPTDMILITNDAPLVKKVNNNTYAIRTSNRTRIDSINLTITGGASSDAGVYVNGNDTVIDRIKVVSVNGDQIGPNALLVGSISGQVYNVRINSIELNGFQSPMRTYNLYNSTLRNARISNFITGVYVVNTVDTEFTKFEVTGTSPSATGANGQNGMLMEAQSTDFACSNVTFNQWLVDGAPEHSFRIGGALSVIDITFRDCLSRRPGNAAGNVATGGGAFKVLGASGHMHRGIHFINCTAEDSNTNANGTNNFTQFSLGWVDGCSLISPVVRKRSNTYSAKAALFLNAVNDIRIVSPNFRDTQTFAVFLGKDASNTTGEGVTNVKFIGGILHSALTHAIEFTTDTVTTKNVAFDGTSIIGNTTVVRGVRFNAAGSGGAYTNVFLDVSYELNATLPGSGEPSLVTPAAGVMIRYRGPVYGYTITADNGSTMMDTTAGAFKIRKAGAWVAL